MNDLENVTQLVGEKIDLATQEEQNRTAEQFARDAHRAKQLNLLCIRLDAFAIALKSKLRVAVSKDASSARMSFGFSSEWLAHPRVVLTIFPGYNDEKYTVRSKYPENYIDKSFLSLDEVIKVVTETAASVITNAAAPPEKSLPYWYELIGKIISWPIGLGVWAITMFTGGLWGFLFGWIPALVAFALTKYLWLLGLVILLANL